jgi:hypothetical protein
MRVPGQPVVKVLPKVSDLGRDDVEDNRRLV